MQRRSAVAAAALAGILALAAAQSAFAWGFEGHQVIALIARTAMTPKALAAVDQMLAADTDTLTDHDMANEATWADRYRTAHRETADWHFVDLELDHPDLKAACFGFPAQPAPASSGPAEDCVVDKIDAFRREIADPATPAAERLLALKFLLHFVGDVHQPLHASDHQDRGGNCVILALGGARAVNLHSYWDTAVLSQIGPDATTIAGQLAPAITAAQKATWSAGTARDWAEESYAVAKAKAYFPGAPAGCPKDPAPVTPPAGYTDAAGAAAAVQLQKAGVRLAFVLNAAFSR